VFFISMRSPYRKWMEQWETRLSSRDNNRVVRPLDWGVEWTRAWPCVNGLSGKTLAPDANPEELLGELNQRILRESDQFFSYTTPGDFRLESCHPPVTGRTPSAGDHQVLRFTSPVQTPFPANNSAQARWFPTAGKQAVVVLPQWNSDAEGHLGLCRIFQRLRIASLRLSLPYHDVRKPVETERADYAVSSNICRTIDAARQAVIDVRSCLDWLQAQGYDRLGIVGTSLGSCYAFIAAAHDARLRVCAFNHASTYFADVVWTGQSTRHVRVGMDCELDLERLRQMWLAISPMAYFQQFARFQRKSLVVYAEYDLTFLPQFSRDIVNEFRRRGLDFKVSVLPCGHYTCGETPYKYLDAYYLASFLRRAFRGLGR
jgi:dienelactone hydrolase